MVNFEEHVKLVDYIYNRKFSGNKSLKDDLIQIGMVALYNATLTYDEAKGGFSTYATRCIYNDMLRYIRKENKHRINTFSMYECNDEGEDFNILDINGCEYDGGELRECDNDEQREGLMQSYKTVLGKFTERNRKIIEMWVSGVSLQNVGNAFGITREGVRLKISRFKEAYRDFVLSNKLRKAERYTGCKSKHIKDSGVNERTYYRKICILKKFDTKDLDKYDNVSIM